MFVNVASGCFLNYTNSCKFEKTDLRIIIGYKICILMDNKLRLGDF